MISTYSSPSSLATNRCSILLICVLFILVYEVLIDKYESWVEWGGVLIYIVYYIFVQCVWYILLLCCTTVVCI